MAVIDYWGHRLVACSCLPLKKGSLIYGSKDAGRTIHTGTSSPVLKRRVEAMCKALNLADHWVVEKSTRKTVTISGVLDMEAHASARKQGEFYMIDTARMFPPTSPVEDNPASAAIYYNQMRPEAVIASQRPLCADAFSPFAMRGHGGEDKVTTATRHVKYNVIPEFCRWHVNQGKILDMDNLTETMHGWGINMRFLGLVRQEFIRLRDAHGAGTEKGYAADMLEKVTFFRFFSCFPSLNPNPFLTRFHVKNNRSSTGRHSRDVCTCVQERPTKADAWRVDSRVKSSGTSGVWLLVNCIESILHWFIRYQYQIFNQIDFCG